MPHSEYVVEKYMTPFPHTIGKDQTLAKAKELMMEYRCKHLPVKHGGKLVGILSHSDLMLVDHYQDLGQVQVEEVMSQEIYQVAPQTTLRAVAAGMAEHHYSSALVVDSVGMLQGIFTWIDLAKMFLAVCP